MSATRKFHTVSCLRETVLLPFVINQRRVGRRLVCVHTTNSIQHPPSDVILEREKTTSLQGQPTRRWPISGSGSEDLQNRMDVHWVYDVHWAGSQRLLIRPGVAFSTSSYGLPVDRKAADIHAERLFRSTQFYLVHPIGCLRMLAKHSTRLLVVQSATRTAHALGDIKLQLEATWRWFAVNSWSDLVLSPIQLSCRLHVD